MTVLDTTAPEITMNVLKNSIIVNVNVTETGSGIERIEYSKDGGVTWVTNTSNKTAKQYIFTSLEEGDYTIKVRAFDNSGNVSNILSQNVSIGSSVENRGQYQYGSWGSGTDENGEYYAINQLPEGAYYSNGETWAPEARVSASTVREALGITADKIVAGQTIAGIAGTYKINSLPLLYSTTTTGTNGTYTINVGTIDAVSALIIHYYPISTTSVDYVTGFYATIANVSGATATTLVGNANSYPFTVVLLTNITGPISFSEVHNQPNKHTSTYIRIYKIQ